MLVVNEYLRPPPPPYFQVCCASSNAPCPFCHFDKVQHDLELLSEAKNIFGFLLETALNFLAPSPSTHRQGYARWCGKTNKQTNKQTVVMKSLHC